MKDENPHLRFRPHHFLCSLGFQGKGYSNDFTANMTAIVMGKLRSVGGDDVMIKVTGQADDICAPCPKRRDTFCTSQDRIDALDARHSAALNLRNGDQLTWADAKSRIRENVRPDDLDQICAGCEWLGLGVCKAAVKRLHEKEKAARS
ncbi:DUF1284 domain-containing protein [Parasulfitobacter algicola]|uniref:DUF1284 domain-containing protein n=1 Tax=Parasulfitobacter algicola TaxID=2614809 RepID=A0ABX2IU54_9RHOB|nr:DUF1284 domain-containing protein [Sulfitobacter algicola]NSX55850.1 DUF1284 domain-containing protein [Sulfitobacter algicola]